MLDCIHVTDMGRAQLCELPAQNTPPPQVANVRRNGGFGEGISARLHGCDVEEARPGF